MPWHPLLRVFTVIFNFLDVLTDDPGNLVPVAISLFILLPLTVGKAVCSVAAPDLRWGAYKQKQRKELLFTLGPYPLTDNSETGKSLQKVIFSSRYFVFNYWRKKKWQKPNQCENRNILRLLLWRVTPFAKWRAILFGKYRKCALWACGTATTNVCSLTG